MVEEKIDDLLKEWDERPVKVSMTPDGQIVGREVECPKCKKMHRVDEPGELKREYLYCDTHDEKVPFPSKLVDQLNEWAKSLNSGTPSKKNSGFVLDQLESSPGRKEIRGHFNLRW